MHKFLKLCEFVIIALALKDGGRWYFSFSYQINIPGIQQHSPGMLQEWCRLLLQTLNHRLQQLLGLFLALGSVIHLWIYQTSNKKLIITYQKIYVIKRNMYKNKSFHNRRSYSVPLQKSISFTHCTQMVYQLQSYAHQRKG